MATLTSLDRRLHALEAQQHQQATGCAQHSRTVAPAYELTASDLRAVIVMLVEMGAFLPSSVPTSGPHAQAWRQLGTLLFGGEWLAEVDACAARKQIALVREDEGAEEGVDDATGTI